LTLNNSSKLEIVNQHTRQEQMQPTLDERIKEAKTRTDELRDNRDYSGGLVNLFELQILRNTKQTLDKAVRRLKLSRFKAASRQLRLFQVRQKAEPNQNEARVEPWLWK
jgi:hypothetical protein